MRESALPYFLRQYANSTTASASAAQDAKDQPAGFKNKTEKVDIVCPPFHFFISFPYRATSTPGQPKATGSIGKHGTAHALATGKEPPSPPSPGLTTPDDESDTVE